MPTDDETPKDDGLTKTQSAEPPPKEPEVDEGPGKGRAVRGKPSAKEG